jgi:hypothetical protein
MPDGVLQSRTRRGSIHALAPVHGHTFYCRRLCTLVFNLEVNRLYSYAMPVTELAHVPRDLQNTPEAV